MIHDRRNYNLPSQLTPGWAPVVVDTALSTVTKLYGGPEGDTPPTLACLVLLLDPAASLPCASCNSVVPGGRAAATPSELAPPSADFVLPAPGTEFQSDDGQVDKGVRSR